MKLDVDGNYKMAASPAFLFIKPRAGSFHSLPVLSISLHATSEHLDIVFNIAERHLNIAVTE